MKHLTPEQLSAMLDATLGDAARAEAERHLASCPQCREALAQMAAQDAALARSLEHDPGEGYFEGFADRVAQRIEAEGERQAVPGPGWGASRRPALAWVGSIVAVAIVAGIVMLSSRESKQPLTRPQIMGRIGQRATPPKASEHAAPPAATSRLTAPVERGGREEGSTAKGLADDSRRNLAKTQGSAPPPSEALRRDAAGEKEQAENLLDRAAPAPSSATGPASSAAPAPVPSTAASHAPQKAGASLSTDSSSLKKREEQVLEAARHKAATPSADFAAPSPGADASIMIEADEFREYDWPQAAQHEVARADSLVLRAEQSGRAADFDAAAAAWRGVSGHVRAKSAEDLRAREREADLRERAFDAGPTDTRRRAAHAAIDRVLEIAPPGPTRERYAKMRERME